MWNFHGVILKYSFKNKELFFTENAGPLFRRVALTPQIDEKNTVSSNSRTCCYNPTTFRGIGNSSVSVPRARPMHVIAPSIR